MGKFCLFSDTAIKAPCFSICLKKYSYLEDFLADKSVNNNFQPYSVPIKIDCLFAHEQGFRIEDKRCINCMFCIFGCPANRVIINKHIHPIDICVDPTQTQISELREHLLPQLFNGSFIKLPKVPLSQLQVKYKSFEEFTAVDETKNIAVWGANAMKYLSASLEPRVALEVGVNIVKRDRNGRLDISLFNMRDYYLFIAETKVSFEKMMAEDRYESQMLAYESELKKCPKNIKRAKFLLIGGEESDMLPQQHSLCTGGARVGQFYNVLKRHKLFFISANALVALGLMKLFVSYDNYNLESLHFVMTNPNYVGLLSCGVVSVNGEILPLNNVISI